MSKCRIILVRHGQSMGNLVHSFLGHTDLPLTELGHAQAEKTAELLLDYNIDVLYSSDLQRAYMTAEHIADKKGLSIIADPQMREIYAGEWENMLFSDIESKYPKEFAVWRNDIGSARCNGGESFTELYDRIIKEVTRIAEQNDGLTVCIATHATPIRCVRLKAHGFDFDKAKDLGWTQNASVTIVDFEDGKFKAVCDHIYEHLNDVATTLPSNV